MQDRFTPIAAARIAWRTLLPSGVRGRLGAGVRALIAPQQAARLPRAAPGNRVPSNTATILGLFSARLGVGIGARLLAEELTAAGVTLRCIDVTDALNAPKDANAPSAAPVTDPGEGPLIVALNPDVAVPALIRFGPQRLVGRRIIGFWVWELARAPRAFSLGQGWVHEIWTPSPFAAAALADLGAPVCVTPHPVGLAPSALPTPVARREARARLGLGEATFTVGSSFSLSSSLDRKNPEGLIAAFAQAFGCDPGAALLVRALEADRYPSAAAALARAARRAGGNVRLIGPEAGIADLYAASDVYASLHRAEGFGLNLAEAMAVGLPVLATDYSGNLAFMDDHCAVLIPASLIPVRDRFGSYGSPGAVWAAPDLDAAAAALLALRSDPVWRARLGAAGQARIKATLGGGAAAAALRMAPHPEKQSG
jgi:glycosyltransferase involved in cell wall biosynthesis